MYTCWDSKMKRSARSHMNGSILQQNHRYLELSTLIGLTRSYNHQFQLEKGVKGAFSFQRETIDSSILFMSVWIGFTKSISYTIIINMNLYSAHFQSSSAALHSISKYLRGLSCRGLKVAEHSFRARSC